MKVAVLTDYLLERDETTFMLEIIINLFPEAPLLTLAHSQGAIAGPIEQRKIFSTFLSHFVKKKTDLAKKSYLIPRALKELPLDNYDFIFCLSRGFSHQFEIQEKQKALIYIVAWDELFKNYKWGLASLFKTYLRKFQGQKLSDTKKLVFSSNYLKSLSPYEGVVMAPFFDSSQSYFCEGDEGFYFLNPLNFTQKEIEIFVTAFESLGLQLKVRTQGEPDYSKAKAVILKVIEEAPFSVLNPLSFGKPVIMNNSELNREFFSKDFCFFYEKIDVEEINRVVTNIEKNYPDIDRKKARRETLKFNGRIFKARLKNLMD